LGEIVACALELEASSDPRAIIAKANQGLAPHQRVRRVAIVDALPVTSSGKLVRGRVDHSQWTFLDPGTPM